MARRLWGRHTAAVLAGVALTHCLSDSAPLAPLAWQKVVGPAFGGSVLGLGAGGAFDERGNFAASALKDGEMVRLYYGGSDASDPLGAGCSGIDTTRWRIGLAESTDGVHFTRVAGTATPSGAILDVGAATDFDAFLAYHPFVLKDAGLYRMWYTGSATPSRDCRTVPSTLASDRRIGYAESTDGVHFAKRNDGAGPGGSVLPLGESGAIDESELGDAFVLKDDAEYKMYYSAGDATHTWRVALAVSSDGHTFRKKPGPGVGGAVLDLGPAGAFDQGCVSEPSVVKERAGLYRMWYRGCASGPGGLGEGTIGYAESNDGVSFSRIRQPTANGDALERGPPGTFDSAGLATPSVFLDGATWNMYYAGVDLSGRSLTGLAQAAKP
jgi:hypothetical protein